MGSLGQHKQEFNISGGVPEELRSLKAESEVGVCSGFCGRVWWGYLQRDSNLNVKLGGLFMSPNGYISSLTILVTPKFLPVIMHIVHT